jgi:hypothetical protein
VIGEVKPAAAGARVAKRGKRDNVVDIDGGKGGLLGGGKKGGSSVAFFAIGPRPLWLSRLSESFHVQQRGGQEQAIVKARLSELCTKRGSTQLRRVRGQTENTTAFRRRSRYRASPLQA